MSTYTREHLEIVYRAAKQKIALEDVIKVIELYETKPTASPKSKQRDTKSSPSPAKKQRKQGKRGRLGKKVVKFLEDKGAKGAHINDIAAAVKSKPANITAWMYTTGKKLTKKVKPATFALAGK